MVNLAKVVYRPVGLVGSIAAASIAGALFKQIWKRVAKEDDAPDALQSEYSVVRVLIAAALQGAIFAVVKAAIDRGGATAFGRPPENGPATRAITPGECSPDLFGPEIEHRRRRPDHQRLHHQWLRNLRPGIQWTGDRGDICGSIGVGLPASAKDSAVRTRWTRPPVAADVDYQLGGAYPPGRAIRVVTRDRSDPPAAGRYSICYLNAFQTQPEARRFWTSSHPDLLLRRNGRLVVDPDWPGEYLLDTSSGTKRSRIASIVGTWIDDCARRGYRAIEPDNLDSWLRSHGRLTPTDNLRLFDALADRAHRRGLAIAQKNAPELSRRAKAVGADFAVAEECQAYAECGAYTKVYGAHVIEIEYTDQPRRFFTDACRARGATVSVLLRDRDVVPRGQRGYHSEHC